MSDPHAGAVPAPTVVLPAAAPPPLPSAVSGTPPPSGPPRTSRLLGAFAIDTLLATLLLVGMSTLFTIPIIAWAMFQQGGEAGAASNIDALVAGLMPELTIASIVAMLASALVLWLARGRSLVDRDQPMRPAPAYALAAVAGIGIQAACVGISLLATTLQVPLDPTNAEPITELTSRWPWLAWLVVVLVAPLAEELLFRHVLLRRFMVAGRGTLGIVATAVLFAYSHEPTPWASEPGAWLVTTSTYVVMGLAFGAVYLRTRRFGAAFVAHACCNLLAMLLLAYSPS